MQMQLQIDADMLTNMTSRRAAATLYCISLLHRWRSVELKSGRKTQRGVVGSQSERKSSSSVLLVCGQQTDSLLLRGNVADYEYS